VTIILNYNIFPHGFNAFFASLLTRRPVIFAEINEDTIYYHKMNFLRPLIKVILFNAKHITVPGSRTEEYWKKYGFKNIYNVHSTINTDIFSPDEKIARNYDFIFVGEFDQNKRPDLILEAFASLRYKGINATICMIGFGSLLKNLKEKIDLFELGDSVTFVTTNNVLEYLRRSKIFVMASLSEGIPCAMMEAMACEMIVLVPPVGDIADVIQHEENGFLHNNSKEELIHYMLKAYKNYDDLGGMRLKARETIINSHSYKVATSKWNDLLTKIR
jgi:glycosyltransferase involved in cell wall biosynthesis